MKELNFSKILMSLSLFLLTSSIVFSQTTTGSIGGKVIDKATKEEMIGVNILVKGTSHGAGTDLEGNYVIDKVNPGEYNIQVSYIGYKRVIYTGIKVVAGQRTVLNIALEEEELTIAQEIVVIGERPIFDIEQANSAVQVKAEDLSAAPIQNVQAIAGAQAGINQTADGIYVRGGKPYETGYYVDGVSAKDPLAGTGFGLDLNVDDIDAVDIVTGGIGAESGATSGLISITTKEGSNKTNFKLSHQRDYFAKGENKYDWSWNYDSYDATLSGKFYPITGILSLMGIENIGDLTYYANFSYSGSDEFTKAPAKQLHSSLFSTDFFAPKQDNRWSGSFKLTWKPTPSEKLFFSYRRSININQSANMLRFVTLTGDVKPGYQYNFALMPDNATTYTSDLNQTILGYTKTLSSTDFIDFRFARLFSKLRADANGRPWRPDSLTEDYNPESIITDPISYWDGSTNQIVYVVQGDPYTAGLYNKGISTIWHDHWAEEYTLKADYTYQDLRKQVQLGIEHVLSQYQWIDIRYPWIGAPIRPGAQSTQLGRSSELWNVSPFNGGIYASYRITEKGFIGSIGLRAAYFNAGSFANDLIYDEASPFPINKAFVKKYEKETIGMFGSHYWLRFLPKVKVSFPVSDNQMLFFNYGHSISWPQAYQLYSRIDEKDVSRLNGDTRGNPTLKPETTVEYELGIRNQLSQNDALTIVAFTKDKFDYITTTGEQEVSQNGIYYSTYKNDDYAKILGIEVTYLTRLSNSIRANASVAYQQASAKSADYSDFSVRKRDEITTKETYLPWDRPWMFKLALYYNSPKNMDGMLGAFLSDWQVNLSSNLQSGKRYSKLTPVGIDNTSGLMSYKTEPQNRNVLIAGWDFWADLGAKKYVKFSGASLVFSLKVTNLFNNQNSTIINPLTGRAYEAGDPYPGADPLKPHPFASTVNPFNPARYLPQRHIIMGVSLEL